MLKKNISSNFYAYFSEHLIHFAKSTPGLNPSLAFIVHWHQAPTLIGCLVFKDLGSMPLHMPNIYKFCLKGVCFKAFYWPDNFTFRFSCSANKNEIMRRFLKHVKTEVNLIRRPNLTLEVSKLNLLADHPDNPPPQA
jgi:hypothetical protein